MLALPATFRNSQRSAVLLIVMKCNWLTIIIALFIYIADLSRFIFCFMLWACIRLLRTWTRRKKCQFKRIFISFLFQFHRFRWKSSRCSTINSHFTTFFPTENEASRDAEREKRHTIEGRVYEIEIKMNDILKGLRNVLKIWSSPTAWHLQNAWLINVKCCRAVCFRIANVVEDLRLSKKSVWSKSLIELQTKEKKNSKNNSLCSILFISRLRSLQLPSTATFISGVFINYRIQ